MFEEVIHVYGRVFRRNPWAVVVFLVVYITIFYFFFRSTILSTTSKRQSLDTVSSEFFQLADGVLSSSEEVTNAAHTLRLAFNSLDRKADGALLEYGFVSLLEDYLVHIRGELKEDGPDHTSAVVAVMT